MGVLDYSTTPASNTSINGIGIEGLNAVSNFDNALRQLMADIATGIPAGTFMATGYVTKSAGYNVVVGDKAKLIDCTAALELDLLAAATAGAGFFIWVKANGGAVTVDPSGSENINGASTSLTVADGSSALVVCTGSAWHSVSIGTGDVTLTGTQTLTNKTLTSPTLNTPTITGLDASTSAKGIIEIATVAEFRSDASGDLALTSEKAWDAVAVVALSDAATISWDMSTGIDFSVTISGNRTLGNPTSTTVGKKGRIKVTASGADRTLDKGSNIKSVTTFPITISSGTSAYLYYDCVSSTEIVVSVVNGAS